MAAIPDKKIEKIAIKTYEKLELLKIIKEAVELSDVYPPFTNKMGYRLQEVHKKIKKIKDLLKLLGFYDFLQKEE